MKLLIFGATGATGQHLVEQALNLGHVVTAFARTPSKLAIRHAHLSIVEGDVLEKASVENVMPGHDAVLSVLGDGAKRSTLRRDGTFQIMKAMRKAGISRLISTSTLGVRDSRQVLSPMYKYFLVPFILKHAFADHEHQEECIEESKLNWTIVRPAALTNGPFTGSYRHGFPATEKKLKLKISRADVADFILQQLNDNRYLHQKPGLSY
jgi:putative NADH-flavin reductase